MRRGRLIAGVVLLIVVLCVAGGVIWVHSMLSPARFTALLRDQVQAAGLRMQLDGPARPTIWPHLAVRLNGLSLRRTGTDAPMLAARQVLLVVPWNSLLHGETRIEKLQIDAPRIDVGQVRAWLTGLQPDNAGVPGAHLPTVEAGLHVVDGTVLDGRSLLLKSLQIDTGTLKSGQVFQLDVQALDADNRALALQVETRPVQEAGTVRFKPLQLYLAAGAPPSLRLAGHLDWGGGLQLAGALDGSLKLARGDYSTSISLPPSVPPAGGEPDARGTVMRVVIDGNGTHMDLHINPVQAWQWWQQISAGVDGSLPLPPVQGSISADSLDVGELRIEGLTIKSTEPTPAASVGAAAAASVMPASSP